MPKLVQVGREFVAPSQRSRLNAIASFPLVLLGVKETRPLPELHRPVSSDALAPHRFISTRDQQLKSSQMTSCSKKRVGCSCVQYVSFRRTATFNIDKALFQCTNHSSTILLTICEEQWEQYSRYSRVQRPSCFIITLRILKILTWI